MSENVPLSEMPGHLIRKLNQHSTYVFQSQMKKHGYDITSVQFAALDTLEKNPDLDQASLAKKISYDRATIGGVIKRLEQKNFVRREIDQNDRRAFRLSLTVDGMNSLKELRPIVEALQNEILPKLSLEEKTKLLQLIRKTLDQ